MSWVSVVIICSLIILVFTLLIVFDTKIDVYFIKQTEEKNKFKRTKQLRKTIRLLKHECTSAYPLFIQMCTFQPYFLFFSWLNTHKLLYPYIKYIIEELHYTSSKPRMFRLYFLTRLQPNHGLPSNFGIFDRSGRFGTEWKKFLKAYFNGDLYKMGKYQEELFKLDYFFQNNLKKHRVYESPLRNYRFI